MHLMYTLDKDGKRLYTLKKKLEDGTITKSAHPGKVFISFPFLSFLLYARYYLASASYSNEVSWRSLYWAKINNDHLSL